MGFVANATRMKTRTKIDCCRGYPRNLIKRRDSRGPKEVPLFHFYTVNEMEVLSDRKNRRNGFLSDLEEEGEHIFNLKTEFHMEIQMSFHLLHLQEIMSYNLCCKEGRGCRRRHPCGKDCC